MKRAGEEKTGGKKAMSYINVNKRVTELSKMKLLEERKPGELTVNIHGRKDFKLTMKGLERLIPFLIDNTEEIQTVIAYMEKFGLDTEAFSIRLLNRYNSMKTLISKYEQLTTENPSSRQFDRGILSGKDITTNEQNTFGIFDKKKIKALSKDLLNLLKEGIIEYDPDTMTLIRTKDKGRKFTSVIMIKPGVHLLETMNLFPTTMQSQKKWELEEEEFEYEQRIQSETIKSLASKNEFKERIKELTGSGYLNYDSRTKLYTITEKGENYISENNFKTVEEFIINKPLIRKKPT